ncbi:MAG: MoxR family ATPase [Acidobacteriota bacterium]|nr:MAG: MoxR family ATPase [Acidobacteriota bacterium]
MTLSTLSSAAALRSPITELKRALSGALRGKPDVVRLALTALLARGHLLVEDVPGVGKTTLAAALARSVGGRFARVQFTADLLPSDLIGVSILEPTNRSFEFRHGPIFTHVLLADEINRATPKTQSALLEEMSEHRVSVDGVTRTLPEPFFVVATQNPLEHHGTFPLPDSQLDRFLLRVYVGYPSADHEREILREDQQQRREDAIEAVLTPEQLVGLQRAADAVRTADAVLGYIVALAHATRQLPGVAIGASPRGSLALHRAAKAWALIDERDYVTPDDVKAVASAVLAHRLVLDNVDDSDRAPAEDAVREVLAAVPVPR